MAFHAASLSSGQIVPRVAIGRVTLFFSERVLISSNAPLQVILGLPRPTSAPALMRCCIGSAVEVRNQGMPLAIRPKIMARYEEAAAALG